MFRAIGCTLKKTYQDIMRNHTMALAAGLSYYFVMSLFPLLILAAAVVSFLPIPNLFDRVLWAMQTVVPADSMGLVRGIMKDVISPSKGSFLTIGILGTVWAASGGFASLIEALNVAYDVPETRPFWKTRLLAVGLMVVVGGLLIGGAVSMFLGPQFGDWLAKKLHLSWVFAAVWPYLRWVLSIAFTVLAVELMFYWAPNVKQRFRATLPGALVGVGFWIAASYGLGLYFQHFAHFNKTYGALGAAVALMVWLYWSWFFILAGAEINSELLKAEGHGRLRLKQPPPKVIFARPAWEEDTSEDQERKAA
ncbi:MAG TPA: YihY/virulence factor BrkB family protein [Terriglobales bacterium]|nr:YihY/virulence factor BrkB family protein [Terriglobales bacterium]